MQATSAHLSYPSAASLEYQQPSRPLDACVICLEPVSERAVAVPCNHCSFDFICLVSWLQERSKCPLCNTQLSAVQYDWRAPDDFKTYGVPPAVTDRDGARSTPPRHIRASHRQHQPRPYRPRPAASQRYSPATSEAAISRRRYVYRHQLYSLHVGSNRISHFRDFTPQLFSRSPELQSRARAWIRRELQVFDFLSPNTPATSTTPSVGPYASTSTTATRSSTAAIAARRASNAEFLLEYIVAILKTVDIKGSNGAAHAKLREFLGADNAALFWHELAAWLRSPYAVLADWDRHVQYRVKLPRFASPPAGSMSSEPDACQHVDNDADYDDSQSESLEAPGLPSPALQRGADTTERERRARRADEARRWYAPD